MAQNDEFVVEPTIAHVHDETYLLHDITVIALESSLLGIAKLQSRDFVQLVQGKGIEASEGGWWLRRKNEHGTNKH
ncbi:hypothetical protein Hypma_008293 [Hypsizygus marmoreus]|uniref:Uncharacterized protein n=1 Tax=Hypsizygus marmoreus TaxID=39966 RepID=A0A369JYK1_HYPMA|nr:hypothetical protein Hypma_008293 [Hypsizygus marmoreus]